MKISVAIATYNRAAMVRQGMEAALAQSRVPDEIVVSDDVSSDETSFMLADLATREPFVISYAVDFAFCMIYARRRHGLRLGLRGRALFLGGLGISALACGVGR